jgi:hypothetical protein
MFLSLVERAPAIFQTGSDGTRLEKRKKRVSWAGDPAESGSANPQFPNFLLRDANGLAPRISPSQAE